MAVGSVLEREKPRTERRPRWQEMLGFMGYMVFILMQHLLLPVLSCVPHDDSVEAAHLLINRSGSIKPQERDPEISEPEPEPEPSRSNLPPGFLVLVQRLVKLRLSSIRLIPSSWCHWSSRQQKERVSTVREEKTASDVR